MARLPRLQVPGELHFVLWRGHNRQAVFLDDEDRKAFLAAAREAAIQHRLAIHAYVLLDNEVRLLATPQEPKSLSLAMQAVGRRYVASFNRRHGRSGTLWEGRFRATVVEASAHFLSAAVVVETAPVEAGLALDAASWPWSSAGHHLGSARDPLVTEHRLYWALGNTPFDREAAYRRRLEQGVSQRERQHLEQAAEKGWAIGSAAFLARLSERTDRPLSARPRGRPRKLLASDMSPLK